MKLSIVIVNFQSDKKVKKLVKEVRGVGVVKVVDNNKNNVGFAAGANIGIREALKNGVEKILLVNPDTKLERLGWLGRLGELGDVESPVVKFKRRGKWIYDFGGRVNWILGRTKHIELSSMNYELCKNKIDYVSGACMVVDRKVFEKIGLFDERFFLYFEDVDFCLRAKKAGFTVRINPKIVVEHQIAEHRFSKNFRKFELAWESNFKFVLKWVWPGFWPLALGYLGGLGILGKLKCLKKN